MYKYTENPITADYKNRYSKLPSGVQKQLDDFERLNPNEYQLLCIKKEKPKLKEGDVFVLSPRANIYFYGKIFRTNISHIQSNAMVQGKNVVFIFNNKTLKPSIDDFNPDYSNLLIPPSIVDDSYWRSGLFYNVGNISINDIERSLDYGFFKFGANANWYCLEDGKILDHKPKIVGIFGIATISGIAAQIGREIIMNPDLVK